MNNDMNTTRQHGNTKSQEETDESVQRVCNRLNGVSTKKCTQEYDYGHAGGQTWVKISAKKLQLMHLEKLLKVEQRSKLLAACHIGACRYPFAFIVAAKIIHGTVWESVFLRDEVFRFWESVGANRGFPDDAWVNGFCDGALEFCRRLEQLEKTTR